MNWKSLDNNTTLDELSNLSFEHPVVIFKHSTRCPISHMALSWFERSWSQEEMGAVEPYYLDLIQYRPVSNRVAEVFGIHHESPQLLLIDKGECTYHSSHSAISYKELKKQLGKE
ncbi:bacillithiol system redox-active protein YtxJ [Cesiribacter sp. SM1]|uniref:bacillithiol system redox-active protein YtxJ n=1 Tax=Cesiribacter sp. SM1 TaxID=2861196 RepID=UPI001CD5BEC2|nr:bacillithiol system redox-active protein YtxJ [Cesiribacter sp. SM1]